MPELPINVVRLKTPEGEVDVVTPFTQATIAVYGLPAEAVIGKLTKPFDPAKPVFSPDGFSRNATFVDFMQAVIARHAPQLPSTLTTVGSEADRVFVVDERTRTPDKSIPGRDVFGAFEFRRGQIVPGSYTPNKDHWILSQDGFFQLPGELSALLLEELRSLRPKEKKPAAPDEVDPLEEAETYLAYGRYPQAQLILDEALRKDPSRADIRAKLRKIRFAGGEWAENFLLYASIAALPLVFATIWLSEVVWLTLVQYAVLLPVPWIMLWLCSKQPGRYDLLRKEDAAGGYDPVAVFFCGVVLALGVILEANSHLHLGPVFAVAAIAVIPMVACFLWLQPQARRTLPQMAGNAAMAAVMLYPYHGAVVAYANEKFDRSEPKVHWIKVEKKWEEPERRRGPSRGLVADWSQAGMSDTWPRISKEVFAAAKEGAPICVLVYSGALGLPWYTLNPSADCTHKGR